MYVLTYCQPFLAVAVPATGTMTYQCCLKNNVPRDCAVALCTEGSHLMSSMENSTMALTLQKKFPLGQCTPYPEQIRQCQQYKEYRGNAAIKYRSFLCQHTNTIKESMI